MMYSFISDKYAESALKNEDYDSRMAEWSNNMFVCEFCQESCIGIRNIFRHLRKYHDGKGISSCSMCENKHFLSSKGLHEHCKVKHPECFQIFCTACRMPFKDHEEVLKHQKECREKAKFQCKSCMRAYRSKLSLFHHFTLKDHRGMICRMCDEEFTDQQEYAKHTDTAHKKVKKYICNDCELVFPTFKRLYDHRDRVHELMERLCPICGWKTMRLRFYRDHMRVHEKGGVQCDICGHFSISKNRRAQHMASHQPYACPKCNYVYLGATRMRQHFSSCKGSEFQNESITLAQFNEMNELKKRDVFHCNGCDKDIKTSPIKHFNCSRKCSEMHRCKYCSLMFRETESLRKHEVSHTGPFFCQECSRGFICWDKVCEHMKVHAVIRKRKITYQYFTELNETNGEENDSVGETGEGENDDNEESISDKELENSEREEKLNSRGTGNVKMEESFHDEKTEKFK